MASSIEAVYLVEASPALREAQHKLLCGNYPLTENPIGFKSMSKYGSIPIFWTENISFVPSSQVTPILLEISSNLYQTLMRPKHLSL